MTRIANSHETFPIVTMNMHDGSVQGHAAGCADLKRGMKKFAEPHQADESWEVADKAEAWLAYNSDFLAEGGEDNAYEIQWLPCAKHVPAGDQHARYEAEFGNQTPIAYQTEIVTHEPVMEVKRGRKWTYLHIDGVQVLEVRTELADKVLATFGL